MSVLLQGVIEQIGTGIIQQFGLLEL